MMSSAADDPLAFVKSSVASDKVAPPPPSPPSLAPPSPLPAPPRTLSLHRLYPARPRLPPRPAQVVIFSKTTCPFCRKTKDLFDGLEVKYTTVELDEMDNGPAVQDALLDSSGQRTVPNVAT
jgi:glutaredoxin